MTAYKTLGDVISDIDSQMKRSGQINDEIRKAVQAAVRNLDSKNMAISERRHATIRLYGGQEWYTAFAGDEASSGGAPNLDQQDGLSEIQFSFDEPASGGTIDNMLSVVDAWHIGVSGDRNRVTQVTQTQFNSIRQSRATALIPSSFTISAQNIGVYPIPIAAGQADGSPTGGRIQFLGRFKPFYPVIDKHGCAYFDQAYDLVVAYARRWLALHYVKDPAEVTLFDAEILRLARDKRGESNDKSKTGRVKGHF